MAPPPKEYLSLLSDIYKVLSNKSTYDYQLDDLGRLLSKRFKGVYSSDTLPELRKGDTAIVNLDNSKQPGSHWCGVYCLSSDSREEKLVIYDSFGRSNKSLFGGADRRLSKAKATDQDAEQNIFQEDCGQRSLAWCLYAETYGIDKAMRI